MKPRTSFTTCPSLTQARRPWTRTVGAAAVLSTASFAIHAQPAAGPGLQLYGLVDAAVGRFASPAGGVNAQDRAVTKLDGGGMSTSHWGVRGAEDLGDGLSAQFELSSFVRNDSGAAGRSDALPAPVNVAADPVFSRAAWVGVSHRDWGRVRLGNVTSLLFLNSITSNAFGDSTVLGPLNLVTFIGSPLTGGTAWANSVVYDSPGFAGFNASVAHSISEGQGGGNSAARWAYAHGPWAASLVWQSVKKNPGTFADGTSPNDTRAWQLAASYDFEVIKLFAHLGRIDNLGTAVAPLNVSYRVWDLSAAVPVGAGRVLAGYAVRRTSDTVGPVPATVAGGNVERKVFTLGYDYFLSKRTDLYAMVMRDSTLTRTLPASPALASARGTSFAVGVRHRF
ncbi:porin [Acidovorax sp. Leaf76]|uniref:porin n=1 Tax=unclassified Acidovorax TaxID=2684926 RepID=UPI0007023A01|nr:MULTISPECIES: porin [unclassified Acidovorax]KQO13569.1 porin [Acidovorax sp. Leaf76]KQO30789.1 porin [Acidovorax sp. Leaf84]KQS27200.1 porin [Acidovorax sp. Leaf191]